MTEQEIRDAINIIVTDYQRNLGTMTKTKATNKFIRHFELFNARLNPVADGE